MPVRKFISRYRVIGTSRVIVSHHHSHHSAPSRVRQSIIFFGPSSVVIPPGIPSIPSRQWPRLEPTATFVLVLVVIGPAAGSSFGRRRRRVRLPVTGLGAVAAGRRGRVGGRRTRGGRRVFLLVLDPSVLEPDLHLFLGQPQAVGDLYAPQPRQVHVAGELAFELQQLVTGERRPDPLRAPRVRVALAVLAQRVRRSGAATAGTLCKRNGNGVRRPVVIR